MHLFNHFNPENLINSTKYMHDLQKFYNGAITAIPFLKFDRMNSDISNVIEKVNDNTVYCDLKGIGNIIYIQSK